MWIPLFSLLKLFCFLHPFQLYVYVIASSLSIITISKVSGLNLPFYRHITAIYQLNLFLLFNYYIFPTQLDLSIDLNSSSLSLICFISLTSSLHNIVPQLIIVVTPLCLSTLWPLCFSLKIFLKEHHWLSSIYRYATSVSK